MPALRSTGDREAAYKEMRASLPAHKMKYSAGKNIVLQFKNRPDLEAGAVALAAAGIATTPDEDWAHRAITRDVAWGIPLPEDLDPAMAGKTLYAWPDSLIAPISFSQVALAARGEDTARYAEFWRDPTPRSTSSSARTTCSSTC